MCQPSADRTRTSPVNQRPSSGPRVRDGNHGSARADASRFATCSSAPTRAEGATMSNADEEPTGSHDLLHLPLAQVVPANANPRLNLEKEPFAELKRSVHQNGLL